MTASYLMPRIALLSGLLVIPAMLAGAPAHADSKNAVVQSTALGAFEYRNFCASCHGPAGKGNGPLAPMMKTAPGDLTLLSQNNGGAFPYERLQKIIDGREEVASHGNRDMPVWGEWFDQQASRESYFNTREMRKLTVQLRIKGLLTYLESLQVKK